MRTKLLRWVLAGLLLTMGSPLLFAQQRNPSVAAADERRVALVIGNSTYKESPLNNPANDATDMAVALKDLGFEVTLRTDANQRQMKQALREFARDIKGGGVGLFYFAGHGVQSHGRNFLVPIGASIESEAEIEDETIDANLVLSYMDEAQNRVNIVVLDACRNNPFARSFRSASRGLTQMEAGKGSFIAFATAPGAVAADGSGRNGVYTEHLLASLKQPDGDIDKVFRRVAAEVSKATGGKQVPWVSTSLTGDFYFRTPAIRVEDAHLKQLEKERADLAKALEEEQKQRNKDAELLRVEMERLREELNRIRPQAIAQPVEAAPTSAATSAQPTKTVPNQAPETPAQVATGSTPLSLPSTGSKPPPPENAEVSLPPAFEQLLEWQDARLSVMANEWKDHLDALRKSRGQLNFSKAIALLVDVTIEKELESLIRYEALLKRMRYNSALALGVTDGGYLSFYRLWNYSNPAERSELALERCNKTTSNTSCRLVMINGEFQEKEFMEVAARLGRQTSDEVRRRYVGFWIPAELAKGTN
jgi:uncharacterized caspase-like protein